MLWLGKNPTLRKIMNLNSNQILHGDCFTLIDKLENNSIDCIVTSPPYWGLRDYYQESQFGNESNFEEYVTKLVNLFIQLKPKLKPSATIWVNLGDTYNNYKCENRNPSHSQNFNRSPEPNTSHFVKKNVTHIAKQSLLMLPARFAIGMIENNFILRNEIIWHKPNPMPESVRNRCTKAHEMFYFFTLNTNYWSDFEAIKTISKQPKDNRNEDRKRKPTKINNGMRKSGVYEKANKRDVWSVPVARCLEAHTAVFPEELIEPCILAGCPPQGLILDPFMGTGTTALMARKHNRNYVGFEINQEYISIANNRLAQQNLFN